MARCGPVDDAAPMTPFEALEYCDAVRSMRVRLVHTSRQPYFCECAAHDVTTASIPQPRSSRNCGHEECLGDIPARSAYARSMLLDAFGGDPVCVPCATARWGVPVEEASRRRRAADAQLRRHLEDFWASNGLERLERN